MSTFRNCFSAALCAAVLSCAALSASATDFVFNFDADTPGSYNSVDTVGWLSLGYFGAVTVCDTTGAGFTNLSGNALVTGGCDPTYGSSILAFTHVVSNLTFDYAISGSDPVEVVFLTIDGVVGTLTLDDNGGTFEGSRTFTGDFQAIFFDPQSTSFSDYALDNISVTAVPEPSSIVLIGTGLLGLAGAVRRRLSA